MVNMMTQGGGSNSLRGGMKMFGPKTKVWVIRSGGFSLCRGACVHFYTS